MFFYTTQQVIIIVLQAIFFINALKLYMQQNLTFCNACDIMYLPINCFIRDENKVELKMSDGSFINIFFQSSYMNISK